MNNTIPDSHDKVSDFTGDFATGLRTDNDPDMELDVPKLTVYFAIVLSTGDSRKSDVMASKAL